MATLKRKGFFPGLRCQKDFLYKAAEYQNTTRFVMRIAHIVPIPPPTKGEHPKGGEKLSAAAYHLLQANAYNLQKSTTWRMRRKIHENPLKMHKICTGAAGKRIRDDISF